MVVVKKNHFFSHENSQQWRGVDENGKALTIPGLARFGDEPERADKSGPSVDNLAPAKSLSTS